MENKKQVIGVTGAKGLLGSELMKIEGTIELEGDITNKETIKEWPIVDYVINCAAKTNVDWCESYIDEAWSTNWFGVRNIVDWCNGIKPRPCLIQISSEMALKPINIYGLTKHASDQMIRNQMPSNSVILYTSHLFGNSDSPKKTFPNWVIEKIYAGVPFEVVDNIYCRPTWIEDIRRSIEWIVNGGYRGDLSVVGKDFISKFDHAQLIERKMVIMDEPSQSMITRSHRNIGVATRQSVDLWKESIPRFSNTTSLEEATETFLKRKLEV